MLKTEDNKHQHQTKVRRSIIRDGIGIKVRPETHEALNKIGQKTDTYDDIIMRLINHYWKRG